jgi:drug/metabolite transporter (DMT)-like permease
VTPHTRARLEVLLTAFLFSTGGAAIKAAHFTSWQVASLRSGIAAVAIWLLLPAARRLGDPARLGLTVATGLSYAATLVLFVLANKLTTAANTIFLQSTAPIYIVLLGPLVLGESIRRRDLAVLAAVGAGMTLFFVGRSRTFATAPDPVSGNLLAALSGITYALMLLGLRALGRHGVQPTGTITLGNLFACLFALPFALPLGGGGSPHPAADWIVVIYLGVIQIGLAYALLTRAIPHLPALDVSLLLFLEPALNPVWAWLVHRETPGPWALTGGGIILGGTLAKVWADAREDR